MLTDRLGSKPPTYCEPSSDPTVLKRLPPTNGPVGASARRTRRAFVRLHADFELENDLSLVYPLTELIQEMVTCTYGDYDDFYRMRLAISLEEAVTNAIVHGNLEISSAMREDARGAYEQLIKQRHLEAPYKMRRARVEVTLERDHLSFVVCDQGPGFQVSKVPNPTAKENLEKVSGRGLALMRSFMDTVVHNRQGNVVTMVKSAPAN